MTTSINAASNVSFGNIRQEYKIPDVSNRDLLRNDIETQMDGTYNHLSQIDRKSSTQIQRELDAITDRKLPNGANYFAKIHGFKKHVNEQKVDFEALKNLHISSLRERIPNRIYTGQRLLETPEKIPELKKAGIKTILYLLPMDEYYMQPTLEAGLNYTSLSRIGNKKLFTRDNGIIKDLISNPELFAEDHQQINDLKEYIDILDGVNPKYPHPIYMGCQWGTNITNKWYSLYEILKDQARDKPLEKEAIEKLSQLLDNLRRDF